MLGQTHAVVERALDGGAGVVDVDSVVSSVDVDCWVVVVVFGAGVVVVVVVVVTVSNI